MICKPWSAAFTFKEVSCSYYYYEYFQAELLMKTQDGSTSRFLNVTKSLGQVIGRENSSIFLYPGDLSMAADTVRTLANVVQFSPLGKIELEDIMKVIIVK